MDTKTYSITIEFERFSKNFEHVTEPKVIPIDGGTTSELRFHDRKGKLHAYNMRQVWCYHVEEE